MAGTSSQTGVDDRLDRTLSHIERECRNCSTCVRQCNFLQNDGTPASITAKVRSGDLTLEKAFACNLCQLCSAVCRHQVAPHELFLEMRRAYVRQGHDPFPEHRSLIDFEKNSTSKRMSWAGLPLGGRKVFFPGCNLSGTRPMAVRKVFEFLQQAYPGIGVVLDCCSKPSHDLGRDAAFRTMFGDLRNWLNASGVEEVLTGCPGCQQMFDHYGAGIRSRSIYEALADHPDLLPNFSEHADVKLHDPCAARFSAGTHEAVRKIATTLGLNVVDMAHHGAATLCCGKGGAAHRYAPSMANHWLEKLHGDAGLNTVVTYCSSCQTRLRSAFKTSHLLDFLTAPEQAARGEIKPPPQTLFTLNRMRLKHFFRRHLDAARQRERTIDYPDTK